MKKFCLIVALILFSITTLYSQEKVKGGYTSCDVFNYTYKSGEIDSTSKRLSTHYKYNEIGNKIEEWGLETGSSKMNKGFFLYNDSGSLIKEIWYHPDSALWKWDTCIYDLKGRIIKRYAYIDSSTIYSITEYKYDKKERIVETKELNPSISEHHTSKMTFKYDLNDNIIEERYCDAKNGTIFYIKEMKYNDSGKKNEEVLTLEDGRINYMLNFKYDAWGNVIEIIEYYDNYEPEYYSRYIYY